MESDQVGSVMKAVQTLSSLRRYCVTGGFASEKDFLGNKSQDLKELKLCRQGLSEEGAELLGTHCPKLSRLELMESSPSPKGFFVIN